MVCGLVITGWERGIYKNKFNGLDTSLDLLLSFLNQTNWLYYCQL